MSQDQAFQAASAWFAAHVAVARHWNWAWSCRKGLRISRLTLHTSKHHRSRCSLSWYHDWRLYCDHLPLALDRDRWLDVLRLGWCLTNWWLHCDHTCLARHRWRDASNMKHLIVTWHCLSTGPNVGARLHGVKDVAWPGRDDRCHSGGYRARWGPEFGPLGWIVSPKKFCPGLERYSPLGWPSEKTWQRQKGQENGPSTSTDESIGSKSFAQKRSAPNGLRDRTIRIQAHRLTVDPSIPRWQRLTKERQFRINVSHSIVDLHGRVSLCSMLVFSYAIYIIWLSLQFINCSQ